MPKIGDITNYATSDLGFVPVDSELSGARATALSDDAAQRLAQSQPQQQAASDDDTGDIVVTGKRIKDDDYRVRLKPFAGAAFKQVIGDNDPSNILSPLYATNGLLFPYTPTIGFTQGVDWKNADLTQTNYEVASYSRTPAVELSVSGKFSVQTNAEGQYLLAVLHFLRTVSKMYFGKADVQTNRAGLPPPVLLFNGYGDYMFNDVRVIVKNHSWTMDDAVNLIPITAGAGSVVRLPALLMLSISLQVIQTPAAQKNEFSLDKFRTGELMATRGGWI